MINPYKNFPPPKKVEKHPELWRFEIEKCRRDFWYFATRWIKTKDPNHKPTMRPFPYSDHLIELNKIVDEDDRVIVEKTRRMQFTWYMSAKCVHKCLFFPNQAIAVQSKKQGDSEDLLGKKRKDFISFILMNLPAFMYDILGKPEMFINEICFPNGSIMCAVAQGEAQMRQFAFSLWFCDEASKQDELELAIGASLPTLEGGGKAVLGSSVRPSFLHEMANDEAGGSGERPDLPIEKEKLLWCGCEDHMGMEVQRNPWNKYTVVRLHYTADPNKDPCTEKGKAWIERAKEGMPEKLWAQEYELDARALGATMILPEFSRSIHIKKKEIKPHWTRYHTMDVGIDAPTAGLWAAVNEHRDIYCYDTYYVRNRTIRDNAVGMYEREEYHKNELNLGKPYVLLVDPAAFKRQYTGTTPAMEYASVEAPYQRYYAPGNNDIIAGICVLKQYLKNAEEGRHPAIYFAPHLTELFWELRNWTFIPGKDKPKEINDHLMACLRYLVMTPPSYIPTEAGPSYLAVRDELTGMQAYLEIREGEKDYYQREEDDDEDG